MEAYTGFTDRETKFYEGVNFLQVGKKIPFKTTLVSVCVCVCYVCI